MLSASSYPQGRVRSPTGGKVRERKLNRFNSGTDSIVWMKEELRFLRHFYALGISRGIFIWRQTIMQSRKKDIRRLVLLALFAAIAYIIVALIRVPVVMFLSYEPKDVIITIGGFLFGPVEAFVTSLVVSLVEMVTISGTGPIGCLMNLISTCSFACVAAVIYKKQHSLKGAMIALLAGSLSMICVMLLWNWLISPLYMHVPRPAVEAMLLPVFLPFNALKAGLNSALILGLYKPLTQALRRARLLPPSRNKSGSTKIGIYLVAMFLLAICILLLLVWQGKI